LSDYVELHCHSGFSLLDGASNPEALIRRAAEIGMEAIALTDHDDLGGIVRWAEAGTRYGVEAIVGVELTMGERGNGGTGEREYASHLTLLAMDAAGYSNLSQLITIAPSPAAAIAASRAPPGSSSGATRRASTVSPAARRASCPAAWRAATSAARARCSAA
jgi:error-prone DNA polymerase